MEGAHTFLSTTKTAKYFGVSRETLARWEDEGVIQCFRTKPGITGHKRYDINSFKGLDDIKKQSLESENDLKHSESPREERGVCYCRVSTRTQADDLKRQIESMQEQYPEFTIIKDFGSGINFKRKGLLKLLEGTIEGDYRTVVVSHRDRLTRFGFELFQWFFKYYRVKLVVLDSSIGSKESELCKDLLSIVHVFSCRANGARRYRKKEVKSEEKEEGED
jgi:predicted site-specific integrase-resolvase